MLPSSIDGVVTVTRIGAAAVVPSLVVELPHGATRTEDYRRTRALLQGRYDDDLVDFFHVNTDVGSPELADAVAAAYVATHPDRAVVIVGCHIPRTFIDPNRVMDAGEAAYREGKVTPGVPPWVVDAADLALLRGRHAAYDAVARTVIDLVCEAGGQALLLHTYAPRSVDVEVDARIVASLRWAYEPDVVERWPLRPEVDLIAREMDGTLRVPQALLDGLVSRYAALGVTVADGKTYPLHPSTSGYHHAARHPGRVVCVEVRRDLVADPWDPFAEMRISAEKVARMAGPLARTLADVTPG